MPSGFHFAKVSDIGEYIEQTFGSTIQAMGVASSVAMVVALAITVLVILLFIKMLLAKDRYAIAVMKAIGFTGRDIQAQYLAQSLFVLAIAVGIGVLLANTWAAVSAGLVVSTLGVSSFRFDKSPCVLRIVPIDSDDRDADCGSNWHC